MLRDKLKGKLSDDAIRLVSNRFDIIGDAAIIKEIPGLKTADKRLIANGIMADNNHIKKVFEKLGKIEGEERVPKLRWLAGEKSSGVLHRENGCTYAMDVKKVFFSPRLSNERLRVYKLAKKSDVVLDMFSGVGPYSILLAKKAREVFSMDINRSAVAYLKENIYRNKINNITVFCGDANKLVKKLDKKFTRIIMNLPITSDTFLKTALSVCDDRTVIHFYSVVNAKDGFKKGLSDRKAGILKKIPERSFRVTGIGVSKAGEIAPYIYRVCLDIRLEKKNQKR